MPKLEPEPEAQKGKKINPFYQLGRKLMNDNKKFFAAFFFISSWAAAVFCLTKNNVVSLFTIKWSC